MYGGQDLNQNTSYEHPYDYKQLVDTCLDYQEDTGRKTYRSQSHDMYPHTSFR